jgi:hypothetical protein
MVLEALGATTSLPPRPLPWVPVMVTFRPSV